jgi:Kef-type K+ transport system membrane component KefB
MADEGSSQIERTVSFVVRLIVSLLLPGWGLAMIVLGFMWGDVLMDRHRRGRARDRRGPFAGSSLVTPYLGGRRLS